MLGITYLSTPVEDSRRVELMGTYFPDRFSELATSLDVDATASTAVADVAALVHGLRVAGSALAIILALLTLPALYLTAKVVTVYEMSQSFMQHMAVLLLVAAASLLLMGSLGVSFLLQLHEDVDAAADDGITFNARLRATSTAVFVVCLILGLLFLPTAAVLMPCSKQKAPIVPRCHCSTWPMRMISSLPV